jgi:hypothetical protein
VSEALHGAADQLLDGSDIGGIELVGDSTWSKLSGQRNRPLAVNITDDDFGAFRY